MTVAIQLSAPLLSARATLRRWFTEQQQSTHTPASSGELVAESPIGFRQPPDDCDDDGGASGDSPMWRSDRTVADWLAAELGTESFRRCTALANLNGYGDGSNRQATESSSYLSLQLNLLRKQRLIAEVRGSVGHKVVVGDGCVF